MLHPLVKTFLVPELENKAPFASKVSLWQWKRKMSHLATIISYVMGVMTFLSGSFVQQGKNVGYVCALNTIISSIFKYTACTGGCTPCVLSALIIQPTAYPWVPLNPNPLGINQGKVQIITSSKYSVQASGKHILGQFYG